MMKGGEFLIYDTDTFGTNIIQIQDSHIQNFLTFFKQDINELFKLP